MILIDTCPLAYQIYKSNIFNKKITLRLILDVRTLIWKERKKIGFQFFQLGDLPPCPIDRRRGGGDYI
jgi:hypothetical protein